MYVRETHLQECARSHTHTYTEAKKKRVSRFNTTQNGDPVDPSQAPPTHDIQHLLDTTKKQIEERKKQTQALLAQARASSLSGPISQGSLIPTPGNIPTLPVSMQAMIASGQSPEIEAIEKARKAAEVRRIIVVLVFGLKR